MGLIFNTDNFQKVIGKGGFGAVYSGQLKDGTQVAARCSRHNQLMGLNNSGLRQASLVTLDIQAVLFFNYRFFLK